MTITYEPRADARREVVDTITGRIEAEIVYWTELQEAPSSARATKSACKFRLQGLNKALRIVREERS